MEVAFNFAAMLKWIVLMTVFRGGLFKKGKYDEKSEDGRGEMLGFRVSRYNSIFPFTSSSDMMIPELADGTEVTLRIIGHLADVQDVSLTTSPTDCGSAIADTTTRIEKESDEVGSITFTTPSLSLRRETLYFCFRSREENLWKHQGNGYWAKLVVVRHFLSITVVLAGIAACIFIAAILNASLLSFVSLNISELRLKVETGAEKMKRIRQALVKLKSKENLILAAFIPGIVFFKTAVAVLLNFVASGWVSVVVSSLLVCLLCEVAPRLRRRKIKKEESTSLRAESSIVFKPKDDDHPDH